MRSRPSFDGLPEIPELAPDYELVRELGRGGTAVVYLARDRELGRDVAVKLIRPSFVQDEDAVARLVREARTVGRLQHPNIVMLFGTRRLSDGGLALLLQYVPGRTLKDRIRDEGPLPVAECRSVLRDLGQALAYAHRARIVHRDIKPENVYLDEGLGIARLADFGIARTWDSDSGLTLPGTAIGTPSYMSPEQVDGRELDGRSDLYSLGLLGYEMLTGRQPWEGESLYAVIYKQKNEALPPLRELRPEIPPALVRAIEGAVRKRPDERWRSAEAFLEALGDGAERSKPVAPTGSPVPSPWSPEGVGHPPQRETPVPVETASARRPPPGPPPAVVPMPARPISPFPELEEDQGAHRDRWSEFRLGILTFLAVAVVVLGGRALVESPVEFRSILGSLGSGTSEAGPLLENSPLLRREGGSWEVLPVLGSDLGALEDGDAVGASTLAGGASQALAILQGDRQSAPSGSPLPSALILQLDDAEGRGIGGVEIHFEVTGGGEVEPAVDRTRPDGSSLTRWTLGASGVQEVRATVPEMAGLEAVFHATLVPLRPASLVSVADNPTAGDPGVSLGEPVGVQVLDDRGISVPGVAVRFEPNGGSGAVEPEVAVTDAGGVARTLWTLGAEPGGQSLLARVADRPELEVVIEARARGVRIPVRPGVLAGGSHSCLLGADGALRCWGANDRGQLGDGSEGRRLAPTGTISGGPFAVAVAGVAHSCALTAEGSAFCWGANDQGQLGVTGGNRAAPARIPEAEALTRLAVGLGHTCGLTPEGAVQCWGDNAQGQLGDGTTVPRGIPSRVAGDVAFREIVAGWRHTCGLDASGRAFCWGSGSSGQLGHGGTARAASPRPVAGGHRFQRLSAGNAHTCGLTTDSRILCWGANDSGQLGSGAADRSPIPVPVVGASRFTGLSAGETHTCGITTSGTALCWGRNAHGQLGDGTTEDRGVPAPVVGNRSFADVHAVGSHTCGRTTQGETYCWGNNVEGQLGDGTRENRQVPVLVSGGP